ncbi:DUF4340 domain-containing protein [Spirochaeta africana]|uniref:DUF4340 domain-containing protein n=1 Tax=Spirochaeta africana (strain ATCC 700263 / DSM 8902 / Z-7692) TaxID=889378 RepID=H9UIZ9_SPIAZ|nr:DUF4340 domain-containing protein [Spirochaeta africana]AFG37492.1 hypothetical protein Spiaf_1429 [Spirochaeta africana DSM 8902]
MKLLTRRQSVYLGLILAIAGALFLGRAGHTEHPPVVSGLRHEDIHRLELQQSAAQPVQLVREQDDWQLEVNGQRYPARASRVDDMVELLLQLRQQREVSRSAAGGFGLDAPVVVTLHDSRQQQTQILFGHLSEARGELYLQKGPDSPVIAGDAAISFYLEQRYPYWQDRRPGASLADADIRRVGLRITGEPPELDWELPTEGYILEQQRDARESFWLYTQDPQRELDQMAVRQMIAAGVRVEAAGLVRDSLDAPWLELFYETSSGGRERMMIGTPDEQGRLRLWREGDLVYLLERSAAERIIRPLANLMVPANAR